MAQRSASGIVRKPFFLSIPTYASHAARKQVRAPLSSPFRDNPLPTQYMQDDKDFINNGNMDYEMGVSPPPLSSGTSKMEDDEEVVLYTTNPFRMPNQDETQLAALYDGDVIDDSAPAMFDRSSSVAAMPSQRMPHYLTQELNPLRARSRKELAARFKVEKSKSNECFVKFIYNQEIACSTLQGADAEMVLFDAAICCDCFFDEIVDGLIDGDLPTKLANPQSRETAICGRETGHPGIYLNSLTDDEGHSPQWQHLWDALQDFKRYISDKFRYNQLRNEIDCQMKPYVRKEDSSEGYRKYLDHADTHETIRGRTAKAATFAKYLKRALKDVPMADRATVRFDILVELGSSTRLLERIGEHEDQNGSNYIMKLFEACLHRRHWGKYKVKQHVIHLLATPDHSALAEILLTRIAQGYVTSGTGFGHYPAGRSVLWKRTRQQNADDFQWVLDNTPIKANQECALFRIKTGTTDVLADMGFPDDRVGELLGAVFDHVIEEERSK